MTDKEMHKLSRRELLHLLLIQVNETEELKQQLAQREEQLTELRENYERLRKRLDQKDAKIHDLQDTLHAERTTRRIELQEAGSIAEAALRLNGIFDIAQKAADQYLENIRILSDRLASGEGYPAFPEETQDMDSGEESPEDMDFSESAGDTAQAEDGCGKAAKLQVAQENEEEKLEEDLKEKDDFDFDLTEADDYDLQEDEEEQEQEDLQYIDM